MRSTKPPGTKSTSSGGCLQHAAMYPSVFPRILFHQLSDSSNSSAVQRDDSWWIWLRKTSFVVRCDGTFKGFAYPFLLDNTIGNSRDNLFLIALRPSCDPSAISLHGEAPVVGGGTLGTNACSDMKHAVDWCRTRGYIFQIPCIIQPVMQKVSAKYAACMENVPFKVLDPTYQVALQRLKRRESDVALYQNLRHIR